MWSWEFGVRNLESGCRVGSFETGCGVGSQESKVWSREFGVGVLSWEFRVGSLESKFWSREFGVGVWSRPT